MERIENEFELAGFVLLDPFYLDSYEDVLIKTLLVRHKERRFGLGCVEQWRKNHDTLFEEFIRLLAPSERTLSEQTFLFGEVPVYADFALFGVLENVTYKGYNQLPDSVPNLVRWCESLRSFQYPT